MWPTFVEINAEVPARGGTRDAVYGHRISFSDGWLSLLTGSDFSRGNLVKSFLRVGTSGSEF